jgi:hypothetical protein
VARRYLREHPDDLAIVGMGGLDDRAAMRAFVDEFGLPFDTVVSEDGRLWARFGIPYQGAWYFLDEDGRGEAVPYDLSGDELADRLDDLLAG